MAEGDAQSSDAQSPKEDDHIPHQGGRRVRKRVRIRTRPTRRQRLKNWWREHGSRVWVWGAVVLAVLALFALVYTGQIRAPAPPPPSE